MGARTLASALVPSLAVVGMLVATPAWEPGLKAQAGASSGALETIEVRPNIFAIVGAGGNVVVQVGPEGAILVNSGSAPMAGKVLAAVKALTAKPIRYIINTSDDADVVGGNAALSAAGLTLNRAAFNVGATGATIFAREEVLLRMSGQASAFPAEGWPAETFTAKQRSMYLNGEGIQIMHMPAAHTDGDSIVMFRRADVIVAGDVVDLRRFPVIDLERGGSIQGEIDALNRLMDLTIPAMPFVWQEDRTLLVPGHGHIADQADVVEYRDMVTIVRDTIQDLITKGMTLEQVKVANPTAGYRTRYGSDTGTWTTDMFVDAVFRSLKSSKGGS